MASKNPIDARVCEIASVVFGVVALINLVVLLILAGHAAFGDGEGLFPSEMGFLASAGLSAIAHGVSENFYALRRISGRVKKLEQALPPSELDRPGRRPIEEPRREDDGE